MSVLFLNQQKLTNNDVNEYCGESNCFSIFILEVSV